MLVFDYVRTVREVVVVQVVSRRRGRRVNVIHVVDCVCVVVNVTFVMMW